MCLRCKRSPGLSSRSKSRSRYENGFYGSMNRRKATLRKGGGEEQNKGSGNTGRRTWPCIILLRRFPGLPQPLSKSYWSEVDHVAKVWVTESITAVRGLQKVLHEVPLLLLVVLFEILEPGDYFMIRPGIHLEVNYG